MLGILLALIVMIPYILVGPNVVLSVSIGIKCSIVSYFTPRKISCKMQDGAVHTMGTAREHWCVQRNGVCAIEEQQGRCLPHATRMVYVVCMLVTLHV